MHLAVRIPAALVALMADHREPLRQWLHAITRAHATTLTGLAREAKVVQSTITRFVNDADYPYELSSRTIRKIEERYGMPAPASRTFSDQAGAGFVVQPSTGVVNAGDKPSTTLETVMAPDDALDFRGLRRGDLCEVDTEAAARVGDMVLAELRSGFKNRELVVRIYDPPYLMAHSTAYELNRPILIEPGRAKVIGVITRILRQTRE